MESVHEGRSKIVELLKEGKEVRFLLSNPSGNEFSKRVKLEERFISNLSESRILFELKSTLANLLDIRAQVPQGRGLKIRFFSRNPNFTIIIVDGKEVLYNKYGRARGKYGADKISLLLRRDIDSEFKKAKALFDSCWNFAVELDLQKIIEERFDRKL